MGARVKVLGQRFAAVAFVVCLGMTWACASRSTPAGPPPPAPPSEPAEVPSGAGPAANPTPALPPASIPAPNATFPDCALISEPGEPIATVALTEAVDAANAPRPANDSERLLFRQLYETLVRVDCNGHVRPGLAASWRLDADQRTWIVTLRENARFSDRTPVTATDVRASWSHGTGPGELRPDVSRLIDSILPRDDRTLAIVLRSTRTDAPVTLAHTDLAIARHSLESVWPLGSRPDGAALRESADQAIVTVERGTLPSIRFVTASGDSRDLLDDDVDLVVTRDPATLQYAATLPMFHALPLEWQRLHVLLTPEPAAPSAPADEAARQRLAADAVRGEARGATGPFWWAALQNCTLPPAEPRPPRTSTPRIVYDADDAVARDLAERFVGLARSSGRRTYERAIGLSGAPLAAARRRGTDAGYIVSLDGRPLDPCRDIQVLAESSRWLDPAAIVPLVETRLRAIVRRGTSGLSAEWDGGLLIAGPSVPKQP